MIVKDWSAHRLGLGILASAILGLTAVLAGPAVDGAKGPTVAAAPPTTLFSTELLDVPGKQLVVVALKFPPATTHTHAAHHHPGSVYVYVTEGTVRLGIEGEPVREIHAGESFFEPPGALHTVAESASSTQSASAIAVMIVPDGAPLLTPEEKNK